MRERLRELANERRRFGYRRLALMLKRDGLRMNLKKVYRLYKEEQLRKIAALSAILLIGCGAAMFYGALSFGFFKMPSLVPSYLAAVVLFAIAAKFSVFFTSIPTIKFWSRISYPLYVVHAVFGYVSMTMLRRFDVSPVVAVALTMCLTTSLAYAIHRTIELWSHRKGRQLAANIRAKVRGPEAWATTG